MKNSLLKNVMLICCVTISMLSSAQHQQISLWPNGAPGSEAKTGEEKIRIYKGEQIFSNIHNPSITVYLPSKEKATGAAVVVAPGGGHKEIWMTHEGYNVAQWLSDHGIAAFILKYRLARDSNSTYTVEKESLADIQRAIRMVKSHAKEWGVDTSRIGVMGFSAGGQLAGLSAMLFDNGNPDAKDPVDQYSSRPSFQALIYPGGSARLEVADNAPPVFLLAGYKDQIASGMVDLYLKYKKANVPAEMHIYAEAAHGFGIRETNKGAVTGWIDRFYDWLNDLGFIKK